ncbi:MAG: PEP-CTERM sorting domain-containing protein [Planctomycetota bacterium]
MFRAILFGLFAATVLLATNSALAAVVHDESIDGELSNDNLNPTALNFTVGDNTVIGTIEDAFGLANTDVFTFVVPTGSVWTSLVVDNYQSTDNLAFLAIDDTDSFPYDANQLNLVDFGQLPDDAYIGGTTFGAADAAGGFNLLPRAGIVTGSGFTPPLPSGTYTIYLQQIGAETNYSLTTTIVSTIPEPSSALLLGGIGSVVLLRRRRRS